VKYVSIVAVWDVNEARVIMKVVSCFRAEVEGEMFVLVSGCYG
jgi:hypothetical protein